ncbi:MULTISPECIES: helix-turn-helix domain-containing protein [Acinetobacter]|uniref:helix-turn-helix domain-containing protein n=1 Tax=Acinetobacter TaxID=469 RepID=UPI00209AACC6|nr:helix-turn-helix transcriptional regulator [Acinetobacter schindleri]MCO8068826.1 helix-turn-helix domain-containing protein [Acinetobacter schindleri]
MKFHHSDNPAYIAEVLGQRLKRARLNRDMTQVEVADRAWVSKKTVLKAEKGDVRLADLIAILRALEMLDELDSFLPEPPLSPIQLLKLRGKIRQRASGKSEKSKNESHQSLDW